MLVVVFDAESKAFEAKKALHDLDTEDIIEVLAQAVVARNADGSATVREDEDLKPAGTLAGTTLGALIGVLGGPVGIALGAAAGLAVGATVDIDDARVGEDFVEDVKKKLLPENFALVAEIEEDTTALVDTAMKALGGTIFRRPLSAVRKTVNEKEKAAQRADMAQMKAQHAQAHTDRKIKLQEKINRLDSKIEAELEKSKQRRQAAETQEKAKVEALKVQAEALKAKAMAKHN
jgi:uncharacterized membrane protein